jgi:hypothetical protein
MIRENKNRLEELLKFPVRVVFVTAGTVLDLMDEVKLADRAINIAAAAMFFPIVIPAYATEVVRRIRKNLVEQMSASG